MCDNLLESERRPSGGGGIGTRWLLGRCEKEARAGPVRGDARSDL